MTSWRQSRGDIISRLENEYVSKDVITSRYFFKTESSSSGKRCCAVIMIPYIVMKNECKQNSKKKYIGLYIASIQKAAPFALFPNPWMNVGLYIAFVLKTTPITSTYLVVFQHDVPELDYW